MDNSLYVDEKTHPIEGVWVIKSIIYIIIAGVFLVAFFYFYVFLESNEKGYSGSQIKAVFTWAVLFTVILSNLFSIPLLVLRKINFKYNFGNKDIALKQGIIAKSERHTFYGRIQNIKVNQDFVDKLLNIASLVVETASDSGGAGMMLAVKEKGAVKDISRLIGLFPGFGKAFISIPGLSYQNAASLKNFIMERIKANPIDDAHSGL